MDNYYVYIYFDPRDGTPFYIGKGKNERAWVHLKKDRKHPFTHTIKKLRKLGLDPNVVVYMDRMCEQEAFEVEKELIAFYGRKDLGTGCLCNLTNGGDGISGLLHTTEHNMKISKSLSGKKLSDEHKKNIGIGMEGKKQSLETRQKRSNSMIGKNKGKVRSEEGRKNNSIAQTGKKLSYEHKMKISKSLSGKEFSDEHKRKISTSLIGNKNTLGKRWIWKKFLKRVII